MTEEFFSALHAWHLTKTWGLANGSVGWANEDADYIEAITTLENEQNAMEKEEVDRIKEKNKVKSAKTAKPGKLA